jgi:hypothetical protein
VVDLTIVTCVAPCIAGGRSFEEAATLLEPLVQADVPLVVYAEECWQQAIRARWARESVRVHPTSASRRLASFASRAQLQAALDASPGVDERSLDTFVVVLTKMGMLHDQSIWNPFGTRHLAWVDADVAASVHPRYFTDARLLDQLPCLLGRFLLLTRPAAVTDAAGRPAASRVQGQLFGGALAEIAEANALYYALLEQALRSQELPTEESIFTRMLERHPERFDRFGLQDNGLLGVLFEEMRSGRVAIERTRVY